MGNNRMDMKETDFMEPTIGVYEVSKACEDYIAQMYFNQYGLNIKISTPLQHLRLRPDKPHNPKHHTNASMKPHQ